MHFVIEERVYGVWRPHGFPAATPVYATETDARKALYRIAGHMPPPIPYRVTLATGET